MRRYCTIDGCGGVRVGLGLCSKHYQATRYEEKMKSYHALRYGEKRSAILLKNAEWRKKNPEKVKALQKAYSKESVRRGTEWRKANPERRKEIANAWVKRNPQKANSNTQRRRAKQLNATPVWANKFFIEEIYDLAARRTKLLGYKWEVDHIVPLRHPLVCGLHVERNLRVIPKSSNASKGNRHWPDMPGAQP